MSNENPEETARLTAAVTPDEADVAEAESAVLARVAGGAPVGLPACYEAMCQRLGIGEAPNDPNNPMPLFGPGRFDGLEDRAPVKRLRAEAAVRVAVARFLAQGILIPANGFGQLDDLYLSAQVGVHSNQSTERITVPAAVGFLPSAIQLTPGLQAAPDVAVLRPAEWQNTVGQLLTPRSTEVLTEALTALRRGLYMSAVSQFGAVSEAGWHVLADKLIGDPNTLPARVTKLQQYQHGATAKLQGEVLQHFKDNAVNKFEVAALETFATYLRELRNYGVHPTIPANAAREPAFTNLGCLSVAQQTYHHLAQLIGAATTANITL